MRNRLAVSAFLIIASLAAIGRADVVPKLRASWREKEARVEVFSPDGRTLVSSGDDRFCLRDAMTGEVRAVLAARPHNVHGPKFSSDGRLLYAAVSTDRHQPVWVQDLKVWDVATGREHATFPYISDSINVSTDFYALSPDGKTLAFQDNTERLPIQVKTGTMKLNNLPEITTFHNANSGLSRVKLWDVASWKETATLDGGWQLVFSPDGKTLVTGARDSKDPTARIWDVVSGKLRSEFVVGGEWVKPITFSPDGKLLAIGSGKVETLYNLEDGRTWPVPASSWSSDGPAISRDGRFLFPSGLPWIRPNMASGGPNPCYDLAESPPIRLELGQGDLAIAPDGHRYAVVEGERFKRGPIALSFRDLPSMRETGRVEADGLVGAGFSPDGRRLALMVGRNEPQPGRPGTRYVIAIRIIDPSTARVLATIPSPGPTWGNYGWKFSPDGKTLAVRYRTGSNMSGPGDPSPSDRPMTLELWEVPES